MLHNLIICSIFHVFCTRVLSTFFFKSSERVRLTAISGSSTSARPQHKEAKEEFQGFKFKTLCLMGSAHHIQHYHQKLLADCAAIYTTFNTIKYSANADDDREVEYE